MSNKISISNHNGSFTKRVNATYGTSFKDQQTKAAWKRILQSDNSFLGRFMRGVSGAHDHVLSSAVKKHAPELVPTNYNDTNDRKNVWQTNAGNRSANTNNNNNNNSSYANVVTKGKGKGGSTKGKGKGKGATTTFCNLRIPTDLNLFTLPDGKPAKAIPYEDFGPCLLQAIR